MELALQSHYLRLLHCSWLGQSDFSRLLKQAGTLHGLMSADCSTLVSFGLAEERVEQLQRSQTESNAAAVEQALSWADTPAHEVLCYEDPRYPALLRQLDVAPPVLFVRGNCGVLSNLQLAIVGSRKASSYGLRNAYWMAHELGLAGLTISSGLARGIDARAHQGALAAGQSTIAVIGTGADIVYPGANRKLAEQITENGAIVSEFTLGTPPVPANFPRRNRIMSGLSIGTLVVEAALKSGSLITARLALEQNRDVFAIPGLISSPQSAGCHALINDGARLVQQPDDILQELDTPLLVKQPNDSASESPKQARELANHNQQAKMAGRSRSRLEGLIGYEGSELHYLLEGSGLKYQALLQELLQLEMAGKIRSTGGRYYRI